MSHEAREWVWNHSHSKGTARMVLALIADRCADLRCIAYASVPTLMKRANASRTAVRDALAKLIASGELEQLNDRKGPRGETYYRLPAAALRSPAGVRFRPSGGPNLTLPSAAKGDRDLTPGNGIRPPQGVRFRPEGGADSDPQNRREPKVNGKSSSCSAPLISATEWQIDDDTRDWLRNHSHRDRLGEHALHAADEKWRSYRAMSAPRPATAWAADWRAWIAREHTPAPGRPNLYALPGGTPTPQAGMTRAEAHMAALLAALEEPTGT